MKTYRFEIFGEPVDFVDCREVAEGFASILRGWDMREIAPDPTRAAYVTFRHENGIYNWNTPWREPRSRRLDDPSINVMEAVCDFHYEFIDWFTDRNRDDFCIHMAAVEFAGQAILFPAIQKTGKSTLALHCVERGHRLIGDDVVAIDATGLEAIALGLLPRMRLPLHPTFRDSFKSFVGARAVLSDRRWQYVNLADGTEITPYRTRLPVGGVVILDRRRDARASIVAAPPAHALKALIDRNFAALADPGRIFDQLKNLVNAAQCLRLTYSDPQEAVALLEETFGHDAAGTQQELYRHAVT